MSYKEYLYNFLVKPILSDDALTTIQAANIIDPERLRLGQSGGIHDFFAIFYSIMKLDSPIIVTCPAYPDAIIQNKNFNPTLDNPIPKIPAMVTWKVVRRAPAAIRGKPFNSQRQVKPRVMEEVAKNERYSYTSTIVQDFDNIVQLDCWEKTHYQAELLADYIEHNMVIYASLFKEFGVKEMFFNERPEDEILRDFKIPVIPMRYYVKTETIYKLERHKIEEIRLKLTTKS